MVYILLADGFEIVEAMAPVDMLRRAKLDVKTVGVNGKIATSSNGVPVTCDIIAEELDMSNAECIILPGGAPGYVNLENSDIVSTVIDNAVYDNILVCAICAAPSILGHKGLLNGKNAVCFPGFEEALDGAVLADDFLVRDGNFITAKGAGVSIEFGLEIVKALSGEAVANEIKATIQCR